MPYDNRIFSGAGSHKGFLGVDPECVDSIELRPVWQSHDSYRSDTSEGRQASYHSTDVLLPVEEHGLVQTTPRASASSLTPDDVDTAQQWDGWKLGARLCILVVAAVLALNTAVTSWASAVFGIDGGIGTMHRGTCSAVRSSGLWLHIAINILSSILLGASNYCMQCLCAPTRFEIDRAHSKKSWVDVGIQSVRNLRRISRVRMVLWFMIAGSSIPLHLMFNSAIFVSLTANDYTVAVVTEEFVNGSTWTLPGLDPYTQRIITSMQMNASLYERLDQTACIKEYGVDYLSSRRHAIIVTNSNSTDPLLGFLHWSYGQSLNSWVCGTSLGDNGTLITEPLSDFDCSVSIALGEIDTWVMANQTVDYCLSERVPDICRLQFSAFIMIAVICCNLVKLSCMIFTLWSCKGTALVMTLGDAVASFLDKPDHFTKGMCTVTKKEIESEAWPIDQCPKRWTSIRNFRFEAVGTRRWLLSNALCAIAVITISILLRFAIQNTTTSSDLPTLWSLGFGTVTASSLIRWNHPIFGSPGLMKNILLANSPQLILSFLYLTYNRIYTCMCFSKEWNDFAHYRKPLRVTSPRGSQSSTYFLTLPYKYTAVILTFSILSHWILSQSLFLVAIDVFDEQGALDVTNSILTCGFSCIALVFLIAVGWLVLIAGVGLGFRRYRAGMTLAGSCSAAISAGCHPLADEVDVSLGPVQWGVVSIDKGVGHCALSSGYVSPPIPGRLYLGNSSD